MQGKWDKSCDFKTPLPYIRKKQTLDMWSSLSFQMYVIKILIDYFSELGLVKFKYTLQA